MSSVYSLHFDGSCYPNPGPIAHYGFTLHQGEVLVKEGHGEVSGDDQKSNNSAEYAGLSAGLEDFKTWYDVDTQTNLLVYGDSQLVINQMSKHYKARPSGLYYKYYQRAIQLCKELRNKGVTISFFWVPRAQNQVADDLSKKHLEKM